MLMSLLNRCILNDWLKNFFVKNVNWLKFFIWLIFVFLVSFLVWWTKKVSCLKLQNNCVFMLWCIIYSQVDVQHCSTSHWSQKGRFGGWTPSQSMWLQIAAATWRIQARGWVDSNSMFYQVTLVLVIVPPLNSVWPYLSSDLVRSEREYC